MNLTFSLIFQPIPSPLLYPQILIYSNNNQEILISDESSLRVELKFVFTNPPTSTPSRLSQNFQLKFSNKTTVQQKMFSEIV